MTASENAPSGPARLGTLQDDLLQDLRQTAPMPDPRPGAHRPRPKQPSAAGGEKSPGVELRVTRTRWLAPSMRLASGGQGVVLSAGPISVSLGLSGR